jgi:hypothetical protein
MRPHRRPATAPSRLAPARSRPTPALAAPMTAAALALLGCGELHPPRPDPQVVLAISTVPADVACLRLTATGPGRTFSREVDTMPGASVDESFGGLPLGPVQFLAEAFPAACTSVSKATVPTWISDPSQINIAVGRLSSVSLTLHRNGRAKVSIDFADDLPDAAQDSARD